MSTPTVNHNKSPIHDQLCRCRACKPAAVQSQNEAPSGAVPLIVVAAFVSLLLWLAFIKWMMG